MDINYGIVKSKEAKIKQNQSVTQTETTNIGVAKRSQGGGAVVSIDIMDTCRCIDALSPLIQLHWPVTRQAYYRSLGNVANVFQSIKSHAS